MNWYRRSLPILLAVVAVAGIHAEKPRVIVTTDGEVDDRCSMIRFLLYANEFDVLGLVHSSSKHHWKGDATHPEYRWEPVSWLDRQLDAYEKVYPNLIKHDPDYPRPRELRQVVFVGNIAYEGDMDAPTPGSERIVEVLLERNDEPVWLQAWGGSNTIARALKTIQEEHPECVADVTRKARLYLISFQDSTYHDYIQPEWPGLQTLHCRHATYGALAYRWPDFHPEDNRSYFNAEWMDKNILQGHGPLCDMYEANKDRSFRSEGDSPAFMHAIPVGLDNLDHPEYGGWGGRFVRASDDLFKSADGDGDRPHSIGRWAEAFQNDWAARADWCVSAYADANHPPVVNRQQAAGRTARPGERIALDVTSTSDPDGDQLSFHWWHHQEASTCPEPVEIMGASGASAELVVPAEARPGETIHAVCAVTDDGAPPLTRYARVVVHVAQ